MLLKIAQKTRMWVDCPPRSALPCFTPYHHAHQGCDSKEVKADTTGRDERDAIRVLRDIIADINL